MDINPSDLWKSATAFAGYIVVLVCFVYFAKQKVVRPSPQVIIAGAVRILFLHACLFGFARVFGYSLRECFAAVPNIAMFVVAMGIVLALASVMNFSGGPGDEFFGVLFASLAAAAVTVIGGVGLFVLGPEARSNLIKSFAEEAAPTPAPAPPKPELTHLHDQTGTVEVDLRPLGRVTIDEQSFEARSASGRYIRGGESVVVCGSQGRILHVEQR